MRLILDLLVSRCSVDSSVSLVVGEQEENGG